MKKLCLCIFSLLTTVVLFAQESITDADNTLEPTTDVWYASPWVWVAGAALIIVLLVVLSKGMRFR
ncbi:MAG: hypothetical protein EOO14_09015 [Chitinophagaceae bacterium]|nr:MAG: hypothetical protein EOO14_09015 [Chitinophagaceae bacterium]